MTKSSRIRIAINAQGHSVIMHHLSADSRHIRSAGKFGVLLVSNASLVRITSLIVNAQSMNSTMYNHYNPQLRYDGWSVYINRADVVAYTTMQEASQESDY